MIVLVLNRKFGKTKGKKDGVKPLWLTPPYSTATLVNGSWKKIVSSPKYVDINEWLASNTFDFFNYTNLFYGIITEYCTHRDCPTMSAGPGVEYTWIDSQKRAVKLPASQHVDYVMSWIQNMINEESVFPTKQGSEFPRDFHQTIRGIFRQLFRIFAHIYHSHYEKIVHVSAEPHLNTLFSHFVAFSREFDLLDKKELSPMMDLIVELERIEYHSRSSSNVAQ